MKAALKYVGKSRYTLEDLKEIITILRAPDGCPWDREQDHKSIRRDFLEECYEAIEAIDTEDPVLLREELGDVLFQVAFHSELEREAGRFDLDDVISDVAAKMVQRHPHVFANVTADTTEQVLKKAAKMGADNGTTDDLRESVCKAVSGATEENGAESIGKALFNLTELARRLGVDAEQALSEACRAYIEQFGAEE